MGALASLGPLIGIGSSVLGGGLEAGGQIMGGFNAQSQSGYEASVLKNNAYIANMNAQAAIERGQAAEQESQVSTAQTIGSQRATLAAHGVTVDQDTGLDLQVDSARLGKIDQMTIRRNAEREALAYKMQGINFNIQAKAAKRSGQSAMFAGILGGAGSIIGTAGTVASKWATYNSNQTPHQEVSRLLMATVPTVTQRTVLPDSGALPYTNPESQLSRDYTSRAVVQLGSQIKQAGNELEDALARIQDEDDKREFRKLNTEMSAFARSKTYGDGTAENPGFLNLLGENAIDGYAPAQEQIDKKAKELRDRASNGRVANMFTVAANEQLGALKGQWTNHTADQRMKANQAVSEAHMKEAMSMAASSWADASVTERSMAVLQGEIADQVARGVIPREAAPEALREAQSAMIEKVVSAAMIGSTGAARRILSTYAGEMDGLTVATLNEAIHRQDMQNLGDAEHFDRIAAKKLEEQRDSELMSMYGGIQAGMTEAELYAESLRLGWGPEHYTKALSYSRALEDEKRQSGGGAATNPRAYRDVDVRILTGQATFEEVTSLPFDGPNAISATDQDKLRNRYEEAQRNSPILNSQIVKDGDKQLEIVLNISTDQWGFKDDAAADRYALALIEYHNKANAAGYGKTDPNWASEIVDKYRPTQRSMAALPKPKFIDQSWPPSTKEDMAAQLQKAAEATAEARANGQLTDAEAQEQLLLIQGLEDQVNRIIDRPITATSQDQ